jgi:hypothetical protein
MQGVSGSAALTDMVEAAIGHSVTPNSELADLVNVVVFATGPPPHYVFAEATLWHKNLS